MVRINALSTPWGRSDALEAAEWPRVDALALPKVETADDVPELVSVLRRTGLLTVPPVWAFLETPIGVVNAATLASRTRSGELACLVAGCNDLSKALGTRCVRSWIAWVLDLVLTKQ